MKKICSIVVYLLICATAFALGNTVESHADDAVVGDFTFYTDITGAYVTGYLGNSEKVVIPDRVNDCDVVGIDKSAFSGRKDITSVVMPDTLNYIAEYAFRDCVSIKELIIPASVVRIGAQIADGCTSLETVRFSEGSKVTYVSYFGDNLDALKNIYLPDGLKQIAAGAFRGYGIERIDIPKGVTEIGDRAFESCAYLEELVLPDCMENVNFALARNCNSLKKLVIGESTVDIAEEAFFNCSSLADLSFGNEIRVIQKKAFYNCSSLTAFVAPKELQTVKSQAFYGCTSLDEVKFNEGLGTIGSYAFQKNHALTSVVIPRTVTSIGFGAFANNTELKDMTIYATFASSSNDIFASTTHEINLKYAKECTVKLYDNSEFVNAISKTPCKVELMKGVTSDGVVLYKNGKKVGSYITMKHGETFDLEARMTNGATDYVKWTSSDTAMGTVDQKGKVRTVRGGAFRIVVTTISGKEDNVTIIVDDSANTGRKMAAVIVNNYYEKNEGDEPFKLKATSYPKGKKIKYYTGNDKVASVNKNGKVTINGTGGVKLTLYTAETYYYEQGLGYTTIIVYPMVPDIVKTTSPSSGKIKVKWRCNNAAGYEFKYWPKGHSESAVTLTSTKPSLRTFNASGLKSGSKYTVKLRSYGTYKGKKLYSEWTRTYDIKVK